MVSSKILLLTLLLISGCKGGYCQEHGHTHKDLYVKSTPSQQCPQHYQCHTLLSYLQDGTNSFTSNTTLHFLPGNHSAAVPQPMILVISNISNLALRGPEVGPDEPPVAHIWCNYTMQFQFTNTSNVTLKSLEIQRCGIPHVYSPHTQPQCAVVLSSVSSAILFVSVDSITLENVHIVYSNGFGLVIWNCFGNISIYNSDLYYNGQKSFSTDYSIGGNAFFYYNMNTLPTGHTELQVISSTFRYGYGTNPDCGERSYDIILLSGGLSIAVVVGSEVGLSDIIITVYDSKFHDNQAISGANMIVSVRCSGLPHVYLSILNSSFINGTAQYDGGGLYLHYSSSIINFGSEYATTIDTQSDIVCTITGSVFSGNVAGHSGGGLYASSDKSVSPSAISISNTTFLRNRAEQEGGGAYISDIDIKVTSYTVFSHNKAMRDGGGMHVTPNMTFLICNCLIEDNTARLFGGGLFLNTILKIYINITHSTLSRNTASGGGALSMQFSSSFSVYHSSESSFILIVHCKFLENYAMKGAGIYLTFTAYSLSLALYLNRTTLGGNRAPTIVVESYISRHIGTANLFIDTTYIYSNTVVHLQYGSAVIELINVNKCWIYGTKFINNTGSSVVARHSNIVLQGHVEFSGNTAYTGAALLLDCTTGLLIHGQDLDVGPSFLTLLPNTTVTITNNTALYYGGGIAVNPVCNYGDYCFIQLPHFVRSNFSKELNTYTMIHFWGNKAQITGSSIYGLPLSHCKTTDEGFEEEDAFLALFSIKDGFPDQVVLAQVYSICFCGTNSLEELTCNTELKKSVRPGAEFTVSAMVTGQLNNTYKRAVRASLSTFGDSGGKFGIRKLQEIQEINRSCDQLIYSVLTTAEAALIELQTEVAPNAPHSFINITILQCPLGFELDNIQRKCDCTDGLKLKIVQITCDITSEKIHVPGNVWIGNLSNNRLGAHLHCPFDYCNPESHSIDLSNQHQQCTSNRSGVLCGACNSGFSLALGTARCLDNCSHYYLFLIIPFALAGVVLVFILLKCNLTVSMGTTNALIFYANIIHTNRTIFFPQSNIGIVTRFLTVFIAWLNLDLGFETCLYRGMTAYANTWLQFVFPVYIWLLVLIMIYSSRYSVIASKLIGRNAVSVLATLFLLSYAKLLRTTIAVVSPIRIEDEDRKDHLLWLMDGNVSYFSAPHAVLFIVAIVAILLYIVPLTLLTLLAPYLQARTNHRAMRWVTRIKPLLDAYQGPYKDKYRYWTGVMFIQRIVLFTVFAANTVGNPIINVFAITVSITVTHVYQIYRGRLHKNRLNWFLEGFYSCNLAIFALALFLIMNGSQRSRKYLACVMVGSAFIVFCLTVIWHIDYQTTVISRAVKKIKDHLGNQRRRQAEGPQEANDPPPPRQPQPTVTVIDMRELREPLLTDN